MEDDKKPKVFIEPPAEEQQQQQQQQQQQPQDHDSNGGPGESDEDMFRVILMRSDRETIEYKVKKTLKFSKIVSSYCKRSGQDARNLKFCIDGAQIPADDFDKPLTELDLEDNTYVDVMLAQTGGARF